MTSPHYALQCTAGDGFSSAFEAAIVGPAWLSSPP